MKQWIINLLRWGLGLLFIATAIGKLLDNRGFAGVLNSYQLFPSSTTLVLGVIFSLAELFLGIELLRRYRTIWAAWGIFAMNLGYTFLAIMTNLRGLKLDNCGCFGVFWARPMTWNTALEDSVLTLLSLTLCVVIQFQNSTQRVLKDSDKRTISSVLGG